MNRTAVGHGFARWCAQAVLVLAAALPACGDSSDPDPGEGGGDAHASCPEACEQVEQVCPDTWASVDECNQACESEPFSQTSLDCVVGATDCAGVDVCSD